MSSPDHPVVDAPVNDDEIGRVSVGRVELLHLSRICRIGATLRAGD